jgi:hypothetical protein
MSVVEIFPAVGALLISFFLGGVWHHSIDCHMNSSSEWWIQVPSSHEMSRGNGSTLSLT